MPDYNAPKPEPLLQPASGLASLAMGGFSQARNGIASIGKMAFIGILMALLLIPVSMITGLVQERQYSGDSAQREVAAKWGGTQQVAGPILTVPYRVITTYEPVLKSEKIRYDTTIQYAHFLPEALYIKGGLDPEIRHRGLYDVALFKADLDLQGRFTRPDFSGWRIPAENILWGDAYVSFTVPDVRSLAGAMPLEWNGNKTECVPDNFVGSPVTGGLHTPVDMAHGVVGKDGYAFKMHMRLNGSGTMNFLPLGKETHIAVASGWKTPSFTGAFLPGDNTVGAEGFQANWTTSHLSRSFPQSWRGEEVAAKDWEPFAFGVELLLPVDRYQKTMRCAKYASLFILLTFLVFFMNETFDKRRIHPLQYLLVGCALCLFYMLLLAFTEHIPFDYAYAIATAGVVGLITAYGFAVLSTRKRALALGGMLTGLYAYLFTLLQMEDFALLMGALGLFAILGTVMYLTRRLNMSAGMVAAAPAALTGAA